jgi:hypothetical protein
MNLPFVGGAATGIGAVEILSRFGEGIYRAENQWANWPRFLAAAVAAGGGAFVMRSQRAGMRYEFGEGVMAAGVVQLLQQVWGRYVA